MKIVPLLMLALWGPVAWAGPPETAVEVHPGSDTFVRASAVAAVGVSDPAIATAEWFPSGELLVSGKATGETDVAVLAGGKISGVHVRVYTDLPPPRPTAAMTPEVHAACPDAKVDGSGPQANLQAMVSTEACRKALGKVFSAQTWSVKQTDLTYSIEALQGQLQAIQAAVKSAGVPVTCTYQGATLVLAGTVTRAQADRLVIAVYQQAVGGLPVDDSDLLIAEPDGGAVEAPAEQALPAARRMRPGAVSHRAADAGSR